MEANLPNFISCPGCAERDRRIADLEQRNAALEARIKSLEQKLESALRSGKRQAAPFSKGPPKTAPKPPGRKNGPDYGTHQRRAVPPRIDEVHEAALPPRCPDCAGHVIRTEVVQQYQTEIVRRTIGRQFNVHIGQCVRCHRRVQGRHPLQTSDALGAAASQIGPDAQALAVQLNKEAGLSHGKIKRFFKAAFDLDLSRSGVCRAMLRVAGRCQPVYQSIVRRVQQSPFSVPDETGWRIGGIPAWLHTAVGCDATAYLVHRRRGFEASALLIGPDYEGFLIHDGWAPYEQFVLATHQTCLGHLLRRAGELEESARGGGVIFPRRVKAILRDALAVRDQRDAGELTQRQTINRANVLFERMGELLVPTRANAANERFAAHLWDQHHSLFTFLRFPGVDATNHKAEQAIRPAIINRKVWGGNRTEAGADAQSVLMSVLRTATQRGVDALDFISRTLRACFGQRPQLICDTG